MPETLLDSAWFNWLLLPGLIFLFRIADVTLQTLRMIFVSRGLKYTAPIVGFFEVLIWLVAISQTMRNLTNAMSYVGYAAGFAAGTYVGMWIENKLSLGVVMIRIVTRKDAQALVWHLRERNFGVTTSQAEGAEGKVTIVFTIIKRQCLRQAIEDIRRFNPNAFYSIEDVRMVNEGVFPIRGGPLRRLRPAAAMARKGK